jgi:Transglycosylase SLT domain/D-alanyl-D-alanine carboxypeptidase/Putative Flp pilus-assembly TadE/G-like
VLKAERGQAAVLLVGVLLAVVMGGLFLGIYARAVGAHSDEQRAADLAALAGARAMREAYPRVFELGPGQLSRAAYEAIGRRIAAETAARNGSPGAVVDFPHADAFAPVLIRVRVAGRIALPGHRSAPVTAAAEAELIPETAAIGFGSPGAREYGGPFATRQGKPMRPDVAVAFDRLAAAARGDGISLIVVSAWRSNAEQARLFAAHPDPRWVARPGTSLHRLGTELDLGPASAYGWLAANADRFHFLKRYPWEPWHFGYTLNAGSASVGYLRGGDGKGGAALPAFVPERFAAALARSAQRWSVSAALLAAQLHQESGFNPAAVSGAGAQGIAQFMPATAHAYGLRNPFDPDAAIDAQAHLMRDLLRRFGSVPLALAAYNAGEQRVAACMCIPQIPETVAYVAAILGLLHGAGDVAGTNLLTIRLVR